MDDAGHPATQQERARWGTCPACRAKHDEPCDPNIRFALGRNAYGHAPVRACSQGASMTGVSRAALRHRGAKFRRPELTVKSSAARQLYPLSPGCC
jgi:hypothetical protein